MMSAIERGMSGTHKSSTALAFMLTKDKTAKSVKGASRL